MVPQLFVEICPLCPLTAPPIRGGLSSRERPSQQRPSSKLSKQKSKPALQPQLAHSRKTNFIRKMVHPAFACVRSTLTYFMLDRKNTTSDKSSVIDVDQSTNSDGEDDEEELGMFIAFFSSQCPHPFLSAFASVVAFACLRLLQRHGQSRLRGCMQVSRILLCCQKMQRDGGSPPLSGQAGPCGHVEP